jgi:hypothetical protein
MIVMKLETILEPQVPSVNMDLTTTCSVQMEEEN